MLESFTLFGLAGRRLDYLEQRHGVLTRNIANANTPDFRPSDVREPDYRSTMPGNLPLATSNPAHLVPAAMQGAGPHGLSRPPAEVHPSGNAVSLEEEAGKLRSTAGAHGRVTAIYGKYLQFLKLAVGAQG
ncbi:MAG: flagellar basal body rod protein FlgB [Pseudomonadota bacterium]